MAKDEVVFHDQGIGVLESHIVIAEEFLRQNGKTKNFENMVKTINKLAKEKEESYTPSDDMGSNPSPRVSKDIKLAMAPWLYGSQSVLNKLGLSKSEKQTLMIELNGAINHLTQIILKRVYGFKTTRAPKVDKSNEKLLTDFEYVASGPGGLSKAQRDRHNTTVDVNRQIRGIVQAWITASLIPLMKESRKSYYKQFEQVYQEANPKLIRSNRVYKNIMKHMGKDFLVTFGTTKITDYLKNLRVKPKGDFTKKQLPK